MVEKAKGPAPYFILSKEQDLFMFPIYRVFGLQFFAVGFDDFLIPVEGFLLQAGKIAGTVVVAADIDKSVRLSIK